MTMRKAVALFAVVCAVFAFTGLAMAENRVEVKVTSEPIGYKAVCDKAGGFSLIFDKDTAIMVGDQITIDLSFITSTDYAATCKAIDFEISPGGDAANDATHRYNVATVFDSNLESAPFYTGNNAPIDIGSGAGIYFRIKAADKVQRITIDVLGTPGDGLRVNTASDAVLGLVFLDQKTNADFTRPGIWVKDTAGHYTVAASRGDNTLCINVSSYSRDTVKGNMDSKADKYTFIPSDPQIAHIAAASTLALVTCEKTETGRILCGEKGTQAVDTCVSFDFETGAGYVYGTHGSSNRLIIQSSYAYQLVEYQVKLDILVNGKTGDNGVYWTNESVRAEGYDNLSNACQGSGLGVGTQNNYIYRDGAGKVLSAASISDPKWSPETGSCDVAAAARAVSLLTDQSTLGLADGNDFLLIDIPYMSYDIDDITKDDVVSVKVTLIKAPCGTIFTGNLQIGTLCAKTVDQTVLKTLIYPYFTAMADDGWWDGLVVTNLGENAGEFTALIYEQDGDIGAFTGMVEKHSLYVSTLASALTNAKMVSGGKDGVLGNSACYIVVCTDFDADGFAMIANDSDNTLNSSESMGYIPRVPTYDSLSSFCSSHDIEPGKIPVVIK